MIAHDLGGNKAQLLTAWGEPNRAFGAAGATVSRFDGCSVVSKTTANYSRVLGTACCPNHSSCCTGRDEQGETAAFFPFRGGITHGLAGQNFAPGPGFATVS